MRSAMTPDRYRRVRALFHALLGLPESERRSVLSAQSDDPVVRDAVDALLDQDSSTEVLGPAQAGRLARCLLRPGSRLDVPRGLGDDAWHEESR